MGSIITLTTDFGLADAYVAAMKGVILGINPEARLVDICHEIRPQDIARGAFILSTAYEFFPRRTVHLVVVDPGVGTERRAVILRIPAADFVAPDNGVLSYIFRDYAAGAAAGFKQKLDVREIEVINITSRRFWRPTVSPTFHGRDMLAPVAAHLSRGVTPAEFGEAIDTLTVLPLSVPRREPDGGISGGIVHVDNFGNLITNIRRDDLPRQYSDITVRIKKAVIKGLNDTYGTGDGLMALIGSSKHLEIALRDGCAAAYLQAGVGDEVRIYCDTG
jgi:S-adenosylmethionine hydrolase